MSGRMMRVGYARMRTSLSFDSECTIWRNGVVVSSGVPCVVESTADANQQVEGQNIPVGSFLVAVPVEYTLMQGDYVDERGRRLEIIRTNSPKSYEIRTEAYALMIGDAPP